MLLPVSLLPFLQTYSHQICVAQIRSWMWKAVNVYVAVIIQLMNVARTDTWTITPASALATSCLLHPAPWTTSSTKRRVNAHAIRHVRGTSPLTRQNAPVNVMKHQTSVSWEEEGFTKQHAGKEGYNGTAFIQTFPHSTGTCKFTLLM